MRKVLYIYIFLAVRRVGPYFPNQGLNPRPLHWKRAVLTTGWPGKSGRYYFRHLTWIISFNPPNNPMRSVLYVAPF